MDSSIAARRAAERWFLDRGLPSVITRRARLRAVFPRSAPVLAGYATYAICAFATYLLTGEDDFDIDLPLDTIDHVVLVIALVVVPLAVVVGWIVARMVTDRAQFVVSTVSVVVLMVLWPLEEALRSAPFTSEVRGVLVQAGVIALILLLTATGIGSVLGWAVRLALSQLSAAGNLLIRSLPVVLLTALVFFNTYVWVMASTISPTRMALALAFLAAIAIVFVISGTLERAQPVLDESTVSPRHAARLAGTPFETMQTLDTHHPLTRGERFNVVFILALSQIAQVATIAAVTAAIFFVLGLIVMSPELVASWTHTNATSGIVFGMTVPVPAALIQMTLFLWALTFMYVSARSVGDGEYRSQLLDPLIDDLKLTLLARVRYHSSALLTPAGG